jgi:hypothetical protein
MAREKQYVFSARTTEARLKALNEVKARVNVGWDELVIGAVSAHYGLDREMMTLPKKDKPAKPEEDKAEQLPSEELVPKQPVAEQEQPTDEAPMKKKGKAKGIKK